MDVIERLFPSETVMILLSLVWATIWILIQPVANPIFLEEAEPKDWQLRSTGGRPLEEGEGPGIMLSQACKARNFPKVEEARKKYSRETWKGVWLC